MFNHVAFVYGGIAQPRASAEASGIDLATRCLDQLDSPEIKNPANFPPRLLILLLSPAFLDGDTPERLMAAIRQTFAARGAQTEAEPALLGSSVTAVFYQGQAQREGALLICLASRLLRAQVAVSHVDDREERAIESAAADLLQQLELDFVQTEQDPNPRVDQALLAFLPELATPGPQRNFRAPALHHYLRDRTRARVPIFGGVSAAGGAEDGRRAEPGLQLANWTRHTDSVVAARLKTGFPFSSSIGHGLKPTGLPLKINRLANNGTRIEEFDQGPPGQVLRLTQPQQYVLLGAYSLERDPGVIIARLSEDGHSIDLSREISHISSFALMERDADNLATNIARRADAALHRLHIRNPIGALGIHCHLRLLDLNLPQITQTLETRLGRSDVYVGGFFNGEMGMDPAGRSLFGQWCTANLFVGDELRVRTPAQRGFRAMGEIFPELARNPELKFEQHLEHCLAMIYRTGFPGAMLSLVQEHEGEEWIVARAAVGERFQLIQQETQRPKRGGDILCQVAATGEPRFVPDSRIDPACEPAAVARSGIISQHLIPLKNLKGEVVGVLQIDLGDLTGRGATQHPPYEEELQLFGSLVEAWLMRILNRQESEIAQALDAALKESLREPTRRAALAHFLQLATAAVGAEMSHLRIAHGRGEPRVLIMQYGHGDYFRVFSQRARRRKLASDDVSPTAQAFRASQPVVVNLAQRNDWHRALIDARGNDAEAQEVLGRIGSYAITAVRTDSERPWGALCLQAAQPWFFHRAKVKSLAALGQRVGYLLEHFDRRNRTNQINQAKQLFLLKLSRQLPDEARIDPLKSLEKLTDTLREAAGADIASLFLWEEETERYILRAQSNWHNPDWVDVARYQEGERFTGHAAQQQRPIYVDDMFAHKRARRIASSANYELQMLGYELTADRSIAAIGLPFKIDETTRGIFTLYKRHDTTLPQRDAKGRATRFAPVLDVLQEATEVLAVRVSIALHQLQSDWVEAERRRHEAVLDRIENVEEEFIYQHLCEELRHAFGAGEVAFYAAGRPDGALKWHCAARRRSLPAPLAPHQPDDALRAAAAGGTLHEERNAEGIGDGSDPARVMAENKIKRVCLPLIDETEKHQLLGVLALHWDRYSKPQLQWPHDPERLLHLARRISAKLTHQTLRRERELEAKERKSRLAVEVMAAMVFQSSHRYLNLLEDIRAKPGQLQQAQNERERQGYLTELTQLIAQAPEQVARPLNIARRMRRIKMRSCDLRALIYEVLLESSIDHFAPDIDVQMMIPPGRWVQLDRELCREAFNNIINNAIKAITHQGVLRISATFDTDANRVCITFADNGAGMSAAEITTALTGAVTSQNSTGLGLVVARLLIQAQDGTLKIESEKDQGTRVLVTFPYETMEAYEPDQFPVS